MSIFHLPVLAFYYFASCKLHAYTINVLKEYIFKGRGIIVPVHAIKAYREKSNRVPLILNLGARCR
jgi:hypothetical protein